MLVLGMESSCDETAAAVIDENYLIRSNVIASQINLHSLYGGVVPELASRRHLETVLPVLEQALRKAQVEPSMLDGVVVTCGPGLVGSLLIGLQVAKTFAYVHDLPLVGENHLAGHLAAIQLRTGPEDKRSSPSFPFIGLLASGGHTSLYLVKGLGDFEPLGHTRDDAAGEAFDKVGKMLGLGYPGGPVIDRLAQGGNPERHRFPRAMVSGDNLEFSFSGVKTAVWNFLDGRQASDLKESGELEDICASVQEAIADVLVTKALLACQKFGVEGLVFSGGVAANSRVRSLAEERSIHRGVNVYLPPRPLCTDNAAMIAAAGLHRIAAGEGVDKGWMELNAFPNMPLFNQPGPKSRKRSGV